MMRALGYWAGREEWIALSRGRGGGGCNGEVR